MSAAEIMSPEAAATEAADAVAPIPWHAWLLLFQPRRVLRGLSRVEGVGLAERAPTLWQIELGVLRMWERMFFRSDTIGTCKDGRIRPNLRARLMNRRPLRFPFLVWERVITPWDLSGFLSSKQQAIRHLLGAHHDGTQFVYDLQLLQLHPGGLEELEQQAAAVAAGDTARARWLADLTVYEGYHQALLEGVRRVLEGADELDPDDAVDPDISFRAYLRWCARQPATPAETWAAWRAGRFTFRHGVDHDPES